MTRLLSTESVESPLSLKRLAPSNLTPGSLGEELQRVYIGSLNANNAARIYGRDQVERALDKIDEISIPIGAPSHPPANMKRSEEHTSELQSLMRISYAVFCLKKKKKEKILKTRITQTLYTP